MAVVEVQVRILDDNGLPIYNSIPMTRPLESFGVGYPIEGAMVDGFRDYLDRCSARYAEWYARAVENGRFFNGVEQWARDRGMGELDTAAMVAAAISSPQGTQHLELPVQVLDPSPKELEPRIPTGSPEIKTRFKRDPVL